ncbi:riboflavin synthase [Thioalkalivibrio sp. HK1]|uniref:riboflavin synthase n=1 Tax=Thioalkalivibrio sp. HK1 TaxID=1469245 RepID=UPI001E305CEC|nr:riboflavin synthase [Thioalkalivibrio sp. HK1]
MGGAMFTGIVQAKGRIVERIEVRHAGDADASFVIAPISDARGLDDPSAVAGFGSGSLAIGDSVCIGGVCLTATQVKADSFHVDVSAPTLRLTTIADWQVGRCVNLELALTPSSLLGGHLVSGHVDGIGEVQNKHEDARSLRLDIAIPGDLGRYAAIKGSICIDGVSLTINSVEDIDSGGSDGRRSVVGVNLIPHTCRSTTLGALRVGDALNVEVDTIARYTERLLSYREVENSSGSDADADSDS